MIDVNDLRKGVTFEFDGQIYKVLEYSHNKPGRGNATIRTKLRNLKTGETSELPVTGLFSAIGHDPRTELFKGQLDLDDEGIPVPRDTVIEPGTFPTAKVIAGYDFVGDAYDSSGEPMPDPDPVDVSPLMADIDPRVQFPQDKAPYDRSQR